MCFIISLQFILFYYIPYNITIILLYSILFYSIYFFPLYIVQKIDFFYMRLVLGAIQFLFCYRVLKYDMQNLEVPTIPILGTLVNSGIRVLVYRSVIFYFLFSANYFSWFKIAVCNHNCTYNKTVYDVSTTAIGAASATFVCSDPLLCTAWSCVSVGRQI